MYKELLTVERIRKSTRGQESIAQEVESDRARVLYSASFRRLQRKTQVFPLEDNAAVRTRLTHSLEVAHVGRFLATSVIQKVSDSREIARWGLEQTDLKHAFVVTVEVACLLHDIGNPPFGHFGEAAVAKWFSGRSDSPNYLDFTGFDGNPQGFRIITKLNGSDGLSGMNLTLSQLAATLKYPSTPLEKNHYKKFGAFFSETDALEKIRAKFSLGPEQRHPLAYLMEAADDICYCLSDIEDGVEKRILTHDDFIEALIEEARADSEVKGVIEGVRGMAKGAGKVDETVAFRSSLVRRFVTAASSAYVDKHNEILAGTLKEIIQEDSLDGRILGAIKKVVRNKVYRDPSIQSLELSGYAAITGLLDRFGTLLDLPRETFVKLLEPGARMSGYDVEKRLIDFIAGRHVATYVQATQACCDDVEGWCRAHLIVDYISGMTDSFAMDMHKVLGGTKW
ncbi:dGTPase [Xanthomonas sp. 3272]|uniref:dGTP triphosphohydrolase n=1 Tax=Xanthomonas arboricola TaxID=56448 RepID=UPI001432130E|nr:dNTP triphosphohydrolase [Xanthomonas arboricola]NJC03199.1 dGTPase [Xanthomonas arboricola]